MRRDVCEILRDAVHHMARLCRRMSPQAKKCFAIWLATGICHSESLSEEERLLVEQVKIMDEVCDALGREVDLKRKRPLSVIQEFSDTFLTGYTPEGKEKMIELFFLRGVNAVLSESDEFLQKDDGD